MSSQRSLHSSKKTKKKQAPKIVVSQGLKPPEANFSVKHPDVRHQVELAFKVKGKTYYRFKDDFRMPAGRYKYVYAAAREVDLRMDMETLVAYVKAFKECLNPSNIGKPINLERMWQLVFNLESRTKLQFEPATVRKLASVVYFDDSEELDTWDKKYAEQKIKFWTDNNCYDFFLTRPIAELLNVSGASITSLEEYIQTSEMIIQGLTSGLNSPLQESSSENGKKTL